MKLDKDTLVKHQFWILLGSYLLIWVIAVFWLKVAASEPITKAQDAYSKSQKGLTAAKSNPVNPRTFLPPWEDEIKEVDQHKGKIWNEAWNFQGSMFDWPTAWNSKDMTTPQTPLDDNERFDYKDKYYPQQIEALRKNVPGWLNPVELAGGFDAVFQPQKWKNTPTREEVWLSQEDYWVKRELLWVVLKTMSDLAVMPPVPLEAEEGKKEGEEKKPEKLEGVEARYRFRNQNWEITLHLRRQDGKKDGALVIGGDSTIKNVNPTHRPQPLTNAKGEGVWFFVLQDRLRLPFEVRGEQVSWNQTRTFSISKDGDRRDYPVLDGISWEKIKDHPIYLIQAFDETNSPIRRLDAVALGQQDCRTYAWPLQPNQELLRLDAPAEDPNAPKDTGAAPTGGMSGQPMGGMSGTPGGMSGGPGGMGPTSPTPGMNPSGTQAPGTPAATVSTQNLTPNNELDRNRYLQPVSQDKSVNPPSRHLPLALRFVVEQSHMHEIQLALANSRLRFQITQVEYHHDKTYTPKKKDGEDKDGSSRVFSGGMPGMMMPGSMYGSRRPMSPPGGGPGMPSSPPGGGPTMPSSPPGGGPRPGMGSPQPGMGPGSGPMMMPGQPFGGAPPMMMQPPPSGGRGGRFRPALPTGYRPGGFPPAGTGGDKKQTEAQDQHDDNLVDITIYGIATLYRRPDPPKTTEQPGQPGQPGQPAAPGTPQAGQPGGQPARQPGTPQGGQPAGQQPAQPPQPAPAGKK